MKGWLDYDHRQLDYDQRRELRKIKRQPFLKIGLDFLNKTMKKQERTPRYRKVRASQFNSYGAIPLIKYGGFTESQLDRISKRRLSAIIAKRALVAAYDEENEENTAILDLLVDLRHICDAAHLDFAELDGQAYEHYCDELYEQKEITT